MPGSSTAPPKKRKFVEEPSSGSDNNQDYGLEEKKAKILPGQEDPKPEAESAESESEAESVAESVIDVDFEFFSPQEIDYHGIKNLLRQTFDENVDLGSLADLIIAQGSVGSTVKCDGENSDPYALCTLISFAEDQDNQGVQSVIQFFKSKVSSSSLAKSGEMQQHLQDTGKLALLVSERLINMPAQVVPPMLEMLSKETEDMEFDKIFYISKVYGEVEAECNDNLEDDGDVAPKNKKSKSKKNKTKTETETFYFQAEDELLDSLAETTLDYKPPAKQVSDSRRVFNDFGIEPSRRMMVISRAKFAEYVQAVKEYVQA